MILLATAGYLAFTRAPATAAAPDSAARPAASWLDRVRRVRLAAAPSSLAAASFSSVASVGAVAMIILGAAPMAAAQASPIADTILAQAIDGNSAVLSYRAPGFSLTDQDGRTVTLASLRGKVILLTFLDPVCSTDCPLVGREFRQASQLLAADSRHVELVAINFNPLYTQVSYLRAYDREVGLGGVPNWRYLTGSRAQLQAVYRSYALPLQILPAGSMIGHGDYVFAIDPAGQVRRQYDFNPGPGTTSTQSSFAAELADTARQLLGQS